MSSQALVSRLWVVGCQRGRRRRNKKKARVDRDASTESSQMSDSEGEGKEKHVKAGVDRGSSKGGKMWEGDKEKHLKEAFDGKTVARLNLLKQLNLETGGGWRIVAAWRSDYHCMWTHLETAKMGDKLPAKYAWCFTDNEINYNSKEVKQKLGMLEK